MTLDEMRRPPAPVIFAIVLWALLAAVLPVNAVIVANATEAWHGWATGVFTFPAAMTALGLWQSNRGARVTAIALGIMSFVMAGITSAFVLGITMVLLLAVSRSAREWFTPATLCASPGS
ncbi:hypothetical protein [Streptomyces prunicolor]